jgi:hypothetical protein
MVKMLRRSMIRTARGWAIRIERRAKKDGE